MYPGRTASDRPMANGPRLVILFATLLLPMAPLRGQVLFGNPYDAAFGTPGMRGNPWGLSPMIEPGPMMNFPPAAQAAPAGTVSIDLLRHPLSGRALRLLRKAKHIAELGDHAAAIAALRDALVKQPAAAPYIQSQLGEEYIETHQYAAAVASFREAARILPHETATHSNYGLSLAVSGQLDSAEKELRQALALDHTNAKARDLLEAVRVAGRAARAPEP